MVEALGYDCSVISSQSGAIGIPDYATGNKMKIINDYDWKAFANIIINLQVTEHTPDAFFEHFYWGKIAERAADVINKIK